ncbi:MAG: hypothetical protein GYA57_19060, partial [Myxococcales bacterium]|nr:hypothetical protein [Myxococcales bacterium]
MEAERSGTGPGGAAGGVARRVPPPVVSPEDAGAALRHHRTYVLICVALVFGAVFAVPVTFLWVRPAPAAPAGAGGALPAVVEA